MVGRYTFIKMIVTLLYCILLRVLLGIPHFSICEIAQICINSDRHKRCERKWNFKIHQSESWSLNRRIMIPIVNLLDK